MVNKLRMTKDYAIIILNMSPLFICYQGLEVEVVHHLSISPMTLRQGQSNLVNLHPNGGLLQRMDYV